MTEKLSHYTHQHTKTDVSFECWAFVECQMTSGGHPGGGFLLWCVPKETKSRGGKKNTAGKSNNQAVDWFGARGYCTTK
eukprot:13945624-Ditylum_brightwellii.AAC.1